MRPNKLSYVPSAANLIGYAENVSGATWTDAGVKEKPFFGWISALEHSTTIGDC